MGVFSAWERYEAWNQALSRVHFGPRNEGRPVYLDMDDDILQQVAVEAGVDPANAASDLVAAVRETLYMDAADGAVFDRHVHKLRQWRRTMRVAKTRGQETEPPPVIGLLAVLTLAAEGMQHDGEFASGAYYPRLFELLGIAKDQRARVEDAYRKHAEELWRGLNHWLTSTDGQFGLPTAYSLGKRYIGLPLSQALVRDADRREFPKMFRQFGLAPGSDISPADMELLLGSWLEIRPCPVSRTLELLWQRGDARERIASVAAVELRSWNGAGGVSNTGTVQRADEVHLVCWTRRFPRPELGTTFVARVGTSPAPEELTVLTAQGQPSIAVVPSPGNRLQPATMSGIDGPSLIEGMLRLRDESSGQVVSRPPRRVVPLRHDDLLNAYVEAERVQLGEDSVVLAKDDRGILAAVRDLLGEIARPGFREETGLQGLPAGWSLFTDVQVLAAPAAELKPDLNVLVPLLSSQLSIAGGTKLPGRIRKWSSLDPPEVRAVVQGAESGISVVITALNDENHAPGLPHTWSSTEAALVADIGELHLADGDYEAVLKDGRRIVQQSILRLRSSDTPDTSSLRTETRLAHSLVEEPIAAIRAAHIIGQPAQSLVRGSHASATVSHVEDAAGPVADGALWWTAAKPTPVSPAPVISLAPPEPTSCVVTGAHHMELPLYNGHARWGLISGTCKNCGLIKRYPARIRWWQHRKPNQKATREIPFEVNVAELPKVREGRSSWDVAFDCLVHVHGGSYSALEHVARHMEESPLFIDSYVRSLDARGDVEIRRNDNLTALEWETAPAYLAELATGEYLLTGGWSRQSRHELRRLVVKAGGQFTAKRDPGGPARYAVSGLDADLLREFMKTVGFAGVAQNAAVQILRTLPPLSVIETSLYRVAMPGSRRIKRFHVESASWIPVSFASDPGAYRLESASAATDVFRTATDIERNEAARSTVQLSKHLAARHYGRPLLAYSPERQLLAVPLGADLPGLYGRAAVLCSGLLPSQHFKQRTLAYRDVPQDVAATLTTLLTN